MPLRFLSAPARATAHALLSAAPLCALALPAHAAPASHGPVPSWQTVELGRTGHHYPFPVYANVDLAHAHLDKIRHVLIIIHGLNRDGDNYFQTGVNILALKPGADADTLLIAPKFPAALDRGFDKMPVWSHGRWSAGEASIKSARRPAPVSSFDVLDDLLARVADTRRLPLLQDVVIAGHSAGAQLVQRYAVFNSVDERIKRGGVNLRYVIANPSSYVYFSKDRPKGDGSSFAPFNPGQCPEYNVYKYGLDRIPAELPASGVGPATPAQEAVRLARRYAGRSVTYLLGGADTNPEHRLLDKTCAAEAQGATRLARGKSYVKYEQWLPANHKLNIEHQAYEVTGVGHDSRRMFNSECGVRELAGKDTQAVTGAAACTPLR
ncbi:hypothetical protein [Bordetella sp. N]|uniref:hypothetical protein n=1 Tax=Bordetella sp. N TaxID=1746199 RepID=UPI00071050D2|nr:hypothetical protein [Bordetella sp. N]ALM86943.1 hypothetical protein ASB57_13055 [Bordetella sp. N]